jgi:ANTAR domain
VKVDLFADGAAGGGVRFQRSTADEASDRMELTTEAPRVADPSMDGASGPFVGPDRVTVRFAPHPATRQVCRGFVVCRWDDGYGPTRADAALVQFVVDGMVMRMDRERLADQLQATTELADNWQRAVESNRRIGAAIGILVTRRGLTESQAFENLVRISSITNTKLSVVADTLIRTGRLPATGGRSDTVFRQPARRD